jgi:hypothetical protein
LVTACRRAGSPTRTSPLSVKATTLRVSRLPSALGMTFGLAALRNGDDRIGRAQVDADNLFA